MHLVKSASDRAPLNCTNIADAIPIPPLPPSLPSGPLQPKIIPLYTTLIKINDQTFFGMGALLSSFLAFNSEIKKIGE